MFDIDGLLCWQDDVDLLDFSSLTIDHPECRLILYPVVEGVYIHCFIPHLEVLFDYLIDSNNRIVFFSAGLASRNVIVMETLLIDLFGKNKYKNLKEKGQFEIFSLHHLRSAIPEKGEIYVRNIKDLNILLKANETLDNSILIEDHYYYAAYDQLPCILGMRLEGLLDYPREKNFSKNATYYLLGLFKEYVNSNKGLNQNIQPIRTWFKQFLLDNDITDCYDYTGYDYYKDNCYGNKKIYCMPNGKDPLVVQLIVSGFDEVKKKYPNATLYGFENINDNKLSFLNKENNNDEHNNDSPAVDNPHHRSKLHCSPF